MYKIFKNLFLSLSFFFVFFLLSASSFAGRLFLAPETSQLFSNCESAINIMIDTEGAVSNASDVIIDFNPNEIEIIDQNSSIAGTQVRTGTVYEFYPGNKVESGRIYLTGASIMSSYQTGSSPDIFGSIILKNKAGVTSTSLNFYFISGSTKDSNISDLNSNDLLRTVSGGTYTFVDRGYCGNDVQAPIVSNVKPSPNSQGNPLSSNISFDISDNLSGVNLDSISVDIDGVVYKNEDSEFSFSGDRMKYSIVVNPRTDFLADTQVVVNINARDNASNVMNTYRYSFNQPTLDTAPPYVTNRVPASGSINNPLDSNVSFYIKDDLSGVDIDTILVNINGIDYKNSDETTIITGNVMSYLVVVNPVEDFLANQKVDVKIDASDLRGNKMSTVSYSFNQPVLDTQPPFVINESPKNGTRNVALNSNVSFVLRDLVSGVDLKTVRVEIDGILYQEDDFFEISGQASEYYIEIDPVSDFEKGKEITVSVLASDIRGNNMANPFVFKFNRPAVCGDNIVEKIFDVNGNVDEELSEQCEPPNSPGCDAFCKFEACTVPEEAVCGNLILEQGEECERPGFGFCGLDCKWIDSYVPEQTVEETFNPVEVFNLYSGFLGIDSSQQASIREMLKDSDGDGLPDVIELLIETNPYSWDSDGDGVSDLEELLDYGTDPNVFNAEFVFDLKIVHPENKSTLSSGRVFVRGVGDALKNVNVVARALNGDEFDLGTVQISDNSKFALSSESTLPAGEYLITAFIYNEDGSVFDSSDSIEIYIDESISLPAPSVRSINNVVIRQGEIPQIDDPQPMVAGSAQPGAQIVSVFESSIFSSTIISDASSGFFTVFAPRPLNLGMHKVTVYAISEDGIISEASSVKFEVVEKVSIFDEMSVFIWVIIALVLVGLCGLVYFLYRMKLRKDDINYMKKLISPSFSEKVEGEIKKELGEKGGEKNIFE